MALLLGYLVYSMMIEARTADFKCNVKKILSTMSCLLCNICPWTVYISYAQGAVVPRYVAVVISLIGGQQILYIFPYTSLLFDWYWHRFTYEN